MKQRFKSFGLFALVLALGLTYTTSSRSSQLTSIVLTGQPATGTNGGAIASISLPSINGLGDVAFQSDVTGSVVRNGIFLARGGSVSRIALFGDLAPSGLPFSNSGVPAINDRGQVAFMARLGGGLDNQGVFLYSGASKSTVALTGQNAPGTSGTFGVFGRAGVLLNNAGKIVFDATVKGTSPGNGVFEYIAGVLKPVVLDGSRRPELEEGGFPSSSGWL